MEEFLPRNFSDGNVADVCKYGTERDTLLQPLFLKFGWDCTVFGNFSPRQPYKVIVCVCMCSVLQGREWKEIWKGTAPWSSMMDTHTK